jgi:hypothetical protein
MDVISKPQVAQCLIEFVASLQSEGFTVAIERWDPANGKGIDDLLAAGGKPDLLEGDEVARFIESLKTAGVAGAAEAIEHVEEPDVENEAMPVQPPQLQPEAVMAFPVDVFPAKLRDFIMTVSSSLACPPDFVAVPMLGVAGAAIGASRALEVKPGWYESPRLYIGIVAPPGSAKTPAVSHVCRPLFAHQNKLKQEFDLATAEFEAKQAEWEAAKRALAHSKKGGTS